MILPYSECGYDSEVADTTFSTPKMSQALEHDQSECPVPLPLWLYLRLNTVAKFDQWYSSQNVGYFSASIKKETFFCLLDLCYNPKSRQAAANVLILT